jgi:hypothetical protein
MIRRRMARWKSFARGLRSADGTAPRTQFTAAAAIAAASRVCGMCCIGATSAVAAAAVSGCVIQSASSELNHAKRRSTADAVGAGSGRPLDVPISDGD